MEDLIVFILIGVLIWYASFALPRKKVRRQLDQLARGEGISREGTSFLFHMYSRQVRFEEIPGRRRTASPVFGIYDWSETNRKTLIRADLATGAEMVFLPPGQVQELIDRRHPSVASEIADIKQLLRSLELREENELAARTRQRLLDELDALRRTPSEALQRLSNEVEDSISRTENVRELFGDKPEDHPGQEA